MMVERSGNPDKHKIVVVLCTVLLMKRRNLERKKNPSPVVVVVVVYFQTDIYMYNLPKCYLQLIICIYSLRLHQEARPVMVAQP